MATLPRCRCQACLDIEASYRVPVDAARDTWQTQLDALQAADVRAEAEDQRDTEIRLFIKNHRRRTARAYAQIVLGARFRAMGIQYTPEFDNLAVERGDGTRPEHYACQFQGFLWALGAGDALVVWLPGEEARFFECWNILDLGRAVKQMVGGGI